MNPTLTSRGVPPRLPPPRPPPPRPPAAQKIEPPTVAPNDGAWLLAKPGMKDWYVFQADGNHIGPISTDLLARGVIAGKVQREAHVGARGDTQWYPLLSVPEIQQAIAGLQGQNVGPRPMASVPPAPPPGKDAPTLRDLTQEAVPPAPPVPNFGAPVAPPAAAAPAGEKKEEKKDDKPKAPPMPAYAKYVPFAIFGACLFIAIVEIGVSFAISPSAPPESAASGAPSAATKK
jgi:hypothetical protein